jgi:hypothetical protein
VRDECRARYRQKWGEGLSSPLVGSEIWHEAEAVLLGAHS